MKKLGPWITNFFILVVLVSVTNGASSKLLITLDFTQNY